MGYRDDREALRSEVDALQKELESARGDQQRLAALEQRLDAARREVGAVEAELGRVRARPVRRGPPALLVVGGASVLCAGLAIGGLRLFSSRAPAVVAIAPSTTAATPVVPPIEPPPVVTAPPAPPPAAAPIAPPRRAAVSWTATVTKVHGLSLRVGSPCVVRAAVIPDSSGMHAVDVEVKCGELTIYDEKGHLNGMSMLDSDAKQSAGKKAGTWVYEIAYRDRGDRSATRNQADLDSTAKVGKVWSDNLPEFRVDLAIRPGSAPVDVAVVE